MESYYKQAVLVCDTLYPHGSGSAERNACLLNVVEDFKGYIDRDTLITHCNDITDSLRGDMCRAVLDADITNCINANADEDE